MPGPTARRPAACSSPTTTRRGWPRSRRTAGASRRSSTTSITARRRRSSAKADSDAAKSRWLYCHVFVWRVITLVALLWPSHLSGWLDGAPLDTLRRSLLARVSWRRRSSGSHPSFLRATARSRDDRRDPARQDRGRRRGAAGRLVHHLRLRRGRWCARAPASRTRGTFAPTGSPMIRAVRRS